MLEFYVKYYQIINIIYKLYEMLPDHLYDIVSNIIIFQNFLKIKKSPNLDSECHITMTVGLSIIFTIKHPNARFRPLCSAADTI
jgi:hypothetical protein